MPASQSVLWLVQTNRDVRQSHIIVVEQAHDFPTKKAEVSPGLFWTEDRVRFQMNVNEVVSIATRPKYSAALPSDDAMFVRAMNPYRVKNDTTGSKVCGSMMTPENVNGTYGQ